MADSDSTASPFPQTRWSILASADDHKSSIRHRALEGLCESYWPPLYGFARMRGYSREDSEDLLQGYFCKLLSNEGFRSAERGRGKFRSFLLRGFVNFIRSEWRKETAEKRGGTEMVQFSISADEGEKQIDLLDQTELTPEEAYDRSWAQTVLDQTLLRLRRNYEEKGRGNHYDALLPFLGMSDPPDYVKAAAALKKSVGTTRVEVQRFREAYQKCIRAELADTLESGADVETELREMLCAFAASAK